MADFRNWWITAYMDGLRNSIGTGPRGKEAGFSLNIFQKIKGKSVKVVNITGNASVGGKVLELKVRIYNESGEVADEYTVKADK